MITPQQFVSIQAEAERLGIPRGFARAVMREYLQCEIVFLLSQLRGSEKMALIGGTGLRLLYDLDRFSEDLDFDNCGLQAAMAAALWRKLTEQLHGRGYTVDFKLKSTGQDRGGKLVFSRLLHDLGISPHADEKLTIKLEYTAPRPAPKPAVTVLNRFGFTAQVATEPLSALCARKLIALQRRRRLQPRDLYDLVWFFSRRVAPDRATLRNFGIRSIPAFKDELIRLLHSHRSKFPQYERDLLPLALNSERSAAIKFLPDLLSKFLTFDKNSKLS